VKLQGLYIGKAGHVLASGVVQLVTVLPDEAQVPIQVLHVVHKVEGGEECRAHHHHQHQ
jgi:hypothetical protein